MEIVVLNDTSIKSSYVRFSLKVTFLIKVAILLECRSRISDYATGLANAKRKKGNKKNNNKNKIKYCYS